MTTSTWAPDYTERAQRIWRDYQTTHDLAGMQGQIAAIDPAGGRVWLGASAIDVAERMAAEGAAVPVYLVRVGSEHFIRKGRR